MARRTAVERFFAKVNMKGLDDCWLWTAATIGSQRNEGARYGRFWYEGRMVIAHRWAYEHWIGPIPDDYDVHHTCRNTLCVNPRHLKAELSEDHSVESANHRHGREQKEKIPF